MHKMPEHDVIIIGAGIAGAAMAFELRGRDVLVIDAAPEIASGASGNPKGIIRPFFSLGQDAMRDFYEAAYYYTLEIMAHTAVPILQHGILQLPKSANETRFSAASARAGFDETHLQYCSPQQASDKLQTECRSEALFWPRAVAVNPKDWVQALLGVTPVKFCVSITHVAMVAHDPRRPRWSVTTDKNETFTAQKIIVTTGYATGLLPELAAQLRPRMGQITKVPAAALPTLPCALSFGHYFIPSQNGEDHILGATYEHSDIAGVTADGHHRNITALQNLARVLPVLESAGQKLLPAQCTGRAAVRATTNHHLPLYGSTEPGLFYLTGLGSRGLMSAPFAARHLKDLI